MPAGALCRSDLDGKPERQSAEAVVRVTRLRAHDRLAANGVAGNGTCESHSRNHPAQTPEAWSAGDGQRAAHQDRHRVRLPHEGRVRECSPATMFRRLNWRTRPVPPSKRHCRGSSARFATPARKPCLSKQGVRLSTPPMEQKLRDHEAGEKCGLAVARYLGYLTSKNPWKRRMSVRRLDPNQPSDFEFTHENLAWAMEQIKKYPEGRQQAAVVP